MNDSRLKAHVIFCPTLKSMVSTGSRAELATVQYLIDNLQTHEVGDYRILVNYRMRRMGSGEFGTVEIDILLINKFGVFLIEVKDWNGIIEAKDDGWILSQKYERENVYTLLENKRGIFATYLKNSALNRLNIPLDSLIVLFQGSQNFKNSSAIPTSHMKVVGIEDKLIQIVSRNNGSRYLSDDDILRIKENIYKEHVKETRRIIHYFSILGELVGGYTATGNLYNAYEAVNNALVSERVRIKEFNLNNLSSDDEGLFKRDIEAIYQMGAHPNILQSRTFFPDLNRPDVFYEVTELPDGHRLDEIIENSKIPFPYSHQLFYIEQLCQAIAHAHKNKVYHRNITPETIYISENDTIKLADFDFAKLVGKITITRPGRFFIETKFTSPEIRKSPKSATAESDLYSLGAIWFTLANLPNKATAPSQDLVDSCKIPIEAKKLLSSLLDPLIENRPHNAGALVKQISKLRENSPITR